MENELLTKESSVFYQNRFCDQEDFDLIITGPSIEKDFLRSIYKVKCPGFTNRETLVSDFNYIGEALTYGSSIWITSNQETKTKNIDNKKTVS